VAHPTSSTSAAIPSSSTGRAVETSSSIRIATHQSLKFIAKLEDRKKKSCPRSGRFINYPNGKGARSGVCAKFEKVKISLQIDLLRVMSPAKFIMAEQFSCQESWASALACTFTTARSSSASSLKDRCWTRKRTMAEKHYVRAVQTGPCQKAANRSKVNLRDEPQQGRPIKLEQFPGTN
jgi:hypothetical protein